MAPQTTTAGGELDRGVDREGLEKCSQEALNAGVWSCARVLGVTLPAVLAAHTYWPAFRTYLGVSGKTALAVTPFFGAFFLSSELEMNACARRHHAAKMALRAAERQGKAS